jgi:hypothetical protein
LEIGRFTCFLGEINEFLDIDIAGDFAVLLPVAGNRVVIHHGADTMWRMGYVTRADEVHVSIATRRGATPPGPRSPPSPSAEIAAAAISGFGR